MKRVLLLAAILLAASGVARAETTWICALDGDWVSLRCVADADPAATAPDASATGQVINGTSFPLDDRRSYTVPLWSPATDATMLRELADATMCYRATDCRVVLANLPAALSAPVARIARR